MQAAVQEEHLAAAMGECERLQAVLERLQLAHGELHFSQAALAGRLSEAVAAQQAAQLATAAARAALDGAEARHAASRIVACAVQKAIAGDAREHRDRV